MAEEKEIILTKEGLENLEQELEQLKTVRRKEVTEKIKEALSLGIYRKMRNMTKRATNRLRLNRA